MVKPGESYLKVRRAFGRLLSDQIQASIRVVQYIGGQHMYRNHKGDKDGKPPVKLAITNPLFENAASRKR